jgi:sugar phosphate isomerase/epimerase
VFDIKQSISSGYDPFDFLEQMKNDIVHVHLSDNTSQIDCMPPGRGTFDFKRLFDMLESVNYQGGYVIELYSKGYDVEKELELSKKYFDELVR